MSWIQSPSFSGQSSIVSTKKRVSVAIIFIFGNWPCFYNTRKTKNYFKKSDSKRKAEYSGSLIIISNVDINVYENASLLFFHKSEFNLVTH